MTDADRPCTFTLMQNQPDVFHLELGLTILFCLKGVCTVHIGNRSEVLSEGAMVTIPPMQIYSLEDTQYASVLKSQIALSTLHQAGLTGQERVNCIIDASDTDKNGVKLKALYAGLFRTFINHASEMELRAHCFTLLSFLYENYTEKAADEVAVSIQNAIRVEKVLLEIAENWKQPLSLRSIAADMYVSESFLSRIFHRYTGFNFLSCLSEVRLGYAANDLKTSEKSITDIAYSNGFANTNSFITHFRKKYGMSPGAYRKAFLSNKTGVTLQDNSEPADLTEALFRYDTAERQRPKKTQSVTLSVPIRGGMKVPNLWKDILNLGYAHAVLYAPVQAQIRRAQREIGFRYFRIKGIFDDDLHLYHESENGDPEYDFFFADQVVDFIIEEDALPMIELSWIPSKMAREQFQSYDRCSVLAPPRDMNAWKQMIICILRHWIDRYGRKAILSWRFTLPMFNVTELWPETWNYADYYALYCATYDAVKSVSSAICFGGVGCYTDVAMDENTGLRLLRELRDAHLLPDFLTVQCFSHDRVIQDDRFLEFSASQSSTPSVMSADEDFTKHFIEHYQSILQRENIELPLVVEEWSPTVWQRDLSGDTLFRASWLCKNILENYAHPTELSYWLLVDWLDERIESTPMFHGGYGLITKNGIAKADYRLLQMLSTLGEERIASGKGWYVAKKDDQLQIILYHYAHYDELYRMRYKRLPDPKKAYEMFQPSGNLHFALKLTGLPIGSYIVQNEVLSKEHGSAFDAWLQMGAPSQLSSKEAKTLDQSTVPQSTKHQKEIAGDLLIDENLSPHEIKMITITNKHA